MSSGKAFLEKIHIKNFLSLRNIALPLKPLTVLVGPNASGKSNVLSTLYSLRSMMTDEKLPPVELVQSYLWAGKASPITFQLQANVQEIPVMYELEFKADVNNPFVAEELSIEGVTVISVENGKGEVQDENGRNKTTYTSNKLALKSAGDYGDKPITSALTEFIKSWEIYDFQPEFIRNRLSTFSHVTKELRESLKLDTYGFGLAEVLLDWHGNAPANFRSVSESLASCTNISIEHRSINGNDKLCLLEGYENPIPMEGASDGTLRLIAYNTLLNQSDLPPLIAIEEPERSLHPGALTDIASILEKLSKRTQVIITTHSSQLLDNLKSESLSDTLGVLLLRNRPGLGTEVLNLEDIRSKRESLDDWISDFGMGSAVFDSELLQDLMEEPL